MSVQLVATDVTAAFGSTALVPVGTYHWDQLGRLYQYCKGAATIAQYEYVKISTDSNYTITSMTTTTNPSTEPAQVGCSQNSGITSSTYGWIFRGYGLHTGKFAASCVQDVKIYTTATSGVVDDSATTLVNGLKLITTIVGAASVPGWANGLLLTAVA
jgi:hypothetical protein